MATTLTQLLADLYARGFDPMNDGGTQAARATRWINMSYLALCARADFPWLMADASGTAPVTISDLREVLSVRDSTQRRALQRRPRAQLIEEGRDLTTVGSPTYFYRDSTTSLNVWPANTSDTIQVRYLKKPALLSAPSDPVLVPDEWADLIVDGAVLRAKKGKDDYDSFVQQFETDVMRMVVAEVEDGAQAGLVEDLGGSEDWGW